MKLLAALKGWWCAHLALLYVALVMLWALLSVVAVA